MRNKKVIIPIIALLAVAVIGFITYILLNDAGIIDSASDGIKSTEDSDASLGYIVVDGGKLNKEILVLPIMNGGVGKVHRRTILALPLKASKPKNTSSSQTALLISTQVTMLSIPMPVSLLMTAISLLRPATTLSMAILQLRSITAISTSRRAMKVSNLAQLQLIMATSAS